MKKQLFCITVILITLITSSCSTKKLESYQFTNEPITISLPKNFVRLDAEKISHLVNDKLDETRYNMLIGSFNDLLRGDQTLDIFQNTNNEFHYLLLLNTSNAPVFNTDIFNQLKSAQNHQYGLLMEGSDGLSITEIDSKLKLTDTINMVKMKHRFKSNSEENTFYKTVTLQTQSNRTIISHELTNSEMDSEEYLLKIKVNE